MMKPSKTEGIAVAKKSSKLPYRHWERDEEKEKYWRGKIAEWEKSGLSLRGYCRRNQVPESSFNAWRRELWIRDRENMVGGTGMPEGTTGTVKDSRGRVIPASFRHADSVTNSSSPKKSEESPFVPLQVVDDAKAERIAPASKCCSIELAYPDGRILKFDSGIDIAFLSQLIQSLGESRC